MLILLQNILNGAGENIVRWLEKNAFRLLRLTIGILYLWFGILKFFPELSPAETLATETIRVLSFGILPDNVSILLLASWETLIGIALVFKLRLSVTLSVLLIHMFGTLTPFVIFPEQIFSESYGFTLLGQYILKNVVIISAALAIYVTGKSNATVVPVYEVHSKSDSPS